MSIFKKMLGICSTPQARNSFSWNYVRGKIEIDINLAPELKADGGAVRLEGKDLPGKVLVFKGDDGAYHALRNRCSHIGHRRIDPVPGEKSLKCCSVMGSTYSYDGKVLSGPARNDLESFPVEVQGSKLIVTLS